MDKAVQVLGEQLRVVKCGAEPQLGVDIRGPHCITSWLVEQAADVLSEFSVGQDGRAPKELRNGRETTHDTAEFAEKLHFKLNLKG